MTIRYLIQAILLCLFIGSQASAKTFSGFNRGPNSKTLELIEPIERYIETKDEFKILLVNHPAFYTFPKKLKEVDSFSGFIKKYHIENKKVKIIFNALTREILTIDFIEVTE